MSFLSDLGHGNFGNLGNDLNPSNIFSDFGSDFSNQPGWAKGLEFALPAAALTFATAGADLPALGGLFGADASLGAADAAGAAGSLDALSAGAYGGADAAGSGALGFAGDVGAGTDTSLSSFLGSSAGGTGAATAAPGSLDALATGVQGGVGAPADILAGSTAPISANIPGTLDAVATGVQGGGAQSPGFLSSVTNALAPVGSALKAATPVIGAGALGYDLYSGYQQKKSLDALNASEQQNAASALNTANTENQAAQPLLASGNTLMSYLTTGTLPPNFQAEVKQQVAAQRAAIIQGYASRGMSTNPQQNSGLAQDLANLDLQAQSLSANLESTLSTAGSQMVTTANQLLQSGLSATEFASELPIKVASLDSTLNAQMATAISSFAAALNGGGKPNSISLNLGPNGAIQS